MNLPPIKKKCPECGGEGTFKMSKYSLTPDGPNEYDYDYEYCAKCEGFGEFYNYLTPEQYVNWMRTEGENPEYEMLNSDPVWLMWTQNQGIYDPDCEGGYEREQRLTTYYASVMDERLEDKIVIVARPGQPKPPADWRPEDDNLIDPKANN